MQCCMQHAHSIACNYKVALSVHPINVACNIVCNICEGVCTLQLSFFYDVECTVAHDIAVITDSRITDPDVQLYIHVLYS